MTRGKVWATTAFLLGIAVSVAANVAHTYHPGKKLLAEYVRLHNGSVKGWRPEIGAQIGAAMYPVALLLTIEMLSRVAWPAGKAWQFARFGGAGMVAVVSAIVSYRHMAGLLAAYGEDKLTSAIGPLAVDGLMVVASMALLAIGRAGTDQDANLQFDPLVDPKTIPLDEMPLDPFPETPDTTAAWFASDGQGDGDEDDESTVPDPDPALSDARERFRDVLSMGAVPSIRAIKRELRVGWQRATRIHAALGESN